MRRAAAISWLLGLGYGSVSLCGAIQWIHMLATGAAQGVNPWFIGVFIAGLALLQVAFRLERARLGIQAGNAVGLGNWLMMLLSWLWVQ